MDYVAWCHRVLETIVAMAEADEEVRYRGFKSSRLCAELFRDRESESQDRAVADALLTLREKLCLGMTQTFDKQRFRWLVNSSAYDGADGLKAAWWLDYHEPSDEYGEKIVHVVNQLSEQRFEDHAYLRVVSRTELYSALGRDGNPDADPVFLAYVPLHEGLDSFGGHLKPRGIDVHAWDGDGSLGVRSTYTSIAWEYYREELEKASSNINRILSGSPPEPERIDLAFVDDPVLREHLLEDYREAQLSAWTGAYKGASILSASVIEGMFYAAFLQLQAAGDDKIGAILSRIESRPPHSGKLKWRRVSLDTFILIARQANVIDTTTAGMLETVKDMRDSIHPAAQSSGMPRATKELADHMLSAIPLIRASLRKSLM